MKQQIRIHPKQADVIRALMAQRNEVDQRMNVAVASMLAGANITGVGNVQFEDGAVPKLTYDDAQLGKANGKQPPVPPDQLGARRARQKR